LTATTLIDTAAARLTRPLMFAGAGLAFAGMILAAAPFVASGLWPAGRLAVPPALAVAGAALWLGSAGLLAAAMVVSVRGRFANAPPASIGSEGIDRTTSRRTWHPAPGSTGMIAAWPQSLLVALLSLCAITVVAVAWQPIGDAAGTGSGGLVSGAALLALAFPVLVLERFYGGLAPVELAEARRLSRLLRVPLLALIAVGGAICLRSIGFQWPRFVEQAAGLLVIAVGLELLVRVGAGWFMPAPPRDRPRLVAESAIAGLISPVPASLGQMSQAIERQLGIDLARSWALGFIGRALLPVGFGMAVFAWALTGVTALGVNDRAVYQRFGVPAVVLGPGLHVHLPWPFGVLRRVEFGTVHDVPIVFAPSNSARGGEPLPARTVVGAEDPPPPELDRLWDQSHASEATYLVASEARGRQTFQIVNIDLRLVWRVGMSDDAAIAAAYRTDDPDRLVRAVGGAALARFFAGHTLLGALGESRERIAAAFREELQGELDQLAAGIEIVAVIFEAIHPPPGAASAYHDVQAAELRVRTAIADQEGSAARTIQIARQNGIIERDKALAAAAEQVGQATTNERLFAGDRQADTADSRPFLFERWLDRLRLGLGRGQLVVVDHRISPDQAPTLDLRGLGVPTTPP